MPDGREATLVAPGFLDGLTNEELSELLGPLERRNFAAGSLLVAEGDSPAEMYLVERGTGEVWVRDRQGTQRLVAGVSPGLPVGEMALLTGQPSSATVRATSDMVVAVLSVSDFLRLTETYPRVLRNLGALLAQRLSSFYRHELQLEHGRVIALRNLGALPLLSYALACSIAWHTRRPVALARADSDPGVSDAHHGIADGSNDEARAHVVRLSSSGVDLAAAADELTHAYATVLVEVGPETSVDFAGRTLDLLGSPQMPAARSDEAGWFRTLHSTTFPRGRLGPDEHGNLGVPPLTVADHEAMTAGVLSTDTAAGRALGWAARDLCGLKVGLVLGAGSVKGYAHYGVLRVLERIGLVADYVAGTSIGSIVAATYAMGWSADHALRDMEQTSWRAFRPTFPLRSILSNSGVHRNFRNAAGDRRFEDLDTPLAIVTADLTTGQEVVLRKGLLRTAALASMAIPAVYPPLRIGQRLLVDGGILNPVPISAVTDMGADVVIAVDLAGGARQHEPLPAPEATESTGRLPWLLQTVLRSVEVMQSRIGAVSTGAATILIEPDFSGVPPVSLTTFHKGRPYVEPGERAAEAARPRITAALPWLRRSTEY